MKSATKYIFIAIEVEFLAALITFSTIYTFIFGESIYQALEYLIIPTIVSLIFVSIIGYLIGEKINYAKIRKSIRWFLGVLLLFFLLVIAISIGTIITHDIISFRIWLEIIFLFFVFGGIQTLLIGIWLGCKLSRIKE